MWSFKKSDSGGPQRFIRGVSFSNVATHLMCKHHFDFKMMKYPCVVPVGLYCRPTGCCFFTGPKWWYGCLPSVLVPGLDLCVCQVESRGQVHAVLHAEVFLSLKAPFQLVELVIGEGCPCFTGLFRAHRWTVSATGDFPVPFFFSP